MRLLLSVLTALSLVACVTEPRGLVSHEDYEDWQELRHDRDHDPSDGAPGPPRPGYVGDFAEPDWRHGEFNPPSVNPDALVDDLDVWPQLGNSPWGRSVIDKKGDDVDLLIYGSSEDIDPGDRGASQGGFEASGAAVLRIPF
jgi:hypothetical protein